MFEGVRIKRAFVCAAAGWIVSFGMVHWGGPMARYLPGGLFHLAAFWGALVAGFVLAKGFGRAGPLGWGVAAICACLATVLGAVIGAGTIGLMTYGQPSEGAMLGVVAIADAASSLWLILTWIAAMVCVDAYARWGRAQIVKSAKGIFG